MAHRLEKPRKETRQLETSRRTFRKASTHPTRLVTAQRAIARAARVGCAVTESLGGPSATTTTHTPTQTDKPVPNPKPTSTKTQHERAHMSKRTPCEDDPAALRRKVDYLQRCHIEQMRDHKREIESKNASLLKRARQIERHEKATAKLQTQMRTVKEELREVEGRNELLRLNVGHMEHESKRLSVAEQRVAELEEALAGSADAQIRLKVKQLLLRRYHPDQNNASTTVTKEEVAMDLTQLLDS